MKKSLRIVLAVAALLAVAPSVSFGAVPILPPGAPHAAQPAR